MAVKLRKIVTCVEDIRHDGGPVLDKPIRKGWVAAVITNPFSGRYEPDLQWFMDELKPLGLECSTRLCAALGIRPDEVQAYGKGAIVGVAGEIEHGALWHVPGGYAMRELIGQALAIVPSAAKIGAVGAAIDLPIHHKDAAYVRSHFDAITCCVPDGPRPDELLFALCMSAGGRPHARMGGLEQSAIAKWDGQR
jgi:Amino acid synthesis